MYILKSDDGSVIYTGYAHLEALQQMASKLPASIAKTAGLSKVDKILADIREVNDAANWLAGEMQKYVADTYRKRQLQSAAKRVENAVFLSSRPSTERHPLKTRARDVLVANQVTELQKRLNSVESSYRELLSAGPGNEETRSLAFELRVGAFRQTVDELDAQVVSKLSEWRQRFGVSDHASYRAFLFRLPPQLGAAISSLVEAKIQSTETRRSDFRDLAGYIETQGTRDPSLQQLIDEWEEKIFDSAWYADGALAWIYDDAAQSASVHLSLQAAIHMKAGLTNRSRKEFAGRIDDVISQLSIVRDQGQAALTRWFTERGAAAPLLLHSYLSWDCKRELAAVTRIADRLMLQVGIRPETQRNRARWDRVGNGWR